MRSKILVSCALSAWMAAYLGCAEENSSTRGGSGDEGGAGDTSSSSTGGAGGEGGAGGAGGKGGAGTSVGGGGAGGMGAGGMGGMGAGGAGGMGTGGTGGMGTGGEGGAVGPDCSGLVPQPKPGLGAWYRFGEDTGLVCDWSGNNNHGVVEGAGVTRGVPGPVGSAIAFNGSDGRVHIMASPSLDFLTAATIELWVRLDDVSPGNVGSTVSRGTGNNDKNVLMNSSCGNMQTIFSTLGGTTNVTSNCNVIPVSTWKHIAIVNDGVTLTMYLNGAVTTTAPGGQLGAIPSGLYIGRREQGIFSLNGAIDDVKWWTVARTQPEICADAGGAWQNGACALP